MVDELLGAGFGSWHVETVEETLQLRVTKKGRTLLHVARREGGEVDRAHDREKPRRVALDAPFLRRLRVVDDEGRLVPGRRDKYHQVEALVGALAATWDDALAAGAVRRPTDEEPLRVVDLGCGNGLLTFAAHHHLTSLGLPVHTTGVDRKEQARRHNDAVAADLGWSMDFRVDTVETVELDPPPDVVLALHACDTATDDALARALEWGAAVVLAAPCCHHDVSAQLRGA